MNVLLRDLKLTLTDVTPTVVGNAVDAKGLVANSTMVVVRVFVVCEVVVGASVVIGTVVLGNAVDISTVMLVVSRLVEKWALLGWEVVVGDPVEFVRVIGEVFDFSVLVDTKESVGDRVDVSLLVDTAVFATSVVNDVFNEA